MGSILFVVTNYCYYYFFLCVTDVIIALLFVFYLHGCLDDEIKASLGYFYSSLARPMYPIAKPLCTLYRTAET